MNSARKAGTIKSWACIVVLTFFLPAGATHLTNTFLLSVGFDGDSLLALVADEPATDQHAVLDCPDRRVVTRL